MIIDHRIYATLYALIAMAWGGGFFMISRANPDRADFDLKMRHAKLYLTLVVLAAAVIGFGNFSDWLWS